MAQKQGWNGGDEPFAFEALRITCETLSKPTTKRENTGGLYWKKSLKRFVQKRKRLRGKTLLPSCRDDHLQEKSKRGLS